MQNIKLCLAYCGKYEYRVLVRTDLKLIVCVEDISIRYGKSTILVYDPNLHLNALTVQRNLIKISNKSPEYSVANLVCHRQNTKWLYFNGKFSISQNQGRFLYADKQVQMRYVTSVCCHWLIQICSLRCSRVIDIAKALFDFLSYIMCRIWKHI